jgi:hypothetical protein
VKLHLPVAVFLFLLGAAASLVGDHSHIVTGTTEYLSDAVPFAWSSPIWFPILVGLATVSIAELRLHLPAARPSVTARQGLAGVAAVLGICVTTALVHSGPAAPVNTLIYALAVITWCALGDRYGAVCGVIAAVVGPAVEAVIAAAGLARGLRRSVRGGAVAARALFRVRRVVSLLAEVSVHRSAVLADT